MKRLRKFKWALLATALVVIGSVGLSGCTTTSKVLTTPGNTVAVAEYFPLALLAEPIQLRAGYTHLTQPFEIKGPEQTWNVELGFVRNDQGLTPEQRRAGGSIFCWTDSPANNERARIFWGCKTPSPGLNLRWELLRTDGVKVGEFSYDGLVQQAGGTSAANAITITISGFRNQPAGQYRLRVTVLRDFSELDTSKPHILINKPFFRKLP